MAELGKINTLKVLKVLDMGIFLDGENLGEILMPKRYIPENIKVSDFIDAFIYLDSEDRLIATTEKPFAMVGEFALLKVSAVNKFGAFLNWGLPKDLLVPFREQKLKMEEGKSYIVYIYIDDETNRIAASSKLDKFLDNIPPDYNNGQEVDILIVTQTDIGYKVIVDNLYWGILYKNEVLQSLSKGSRTKGYIKKVRGDNKIDLSINKPGYTKIDDISEKILRELQQHNGFIEITDKSSPEKIANTFGISKKAFKMAIGNLYKARKILIANDGIRLK